MNERMSLDEVLAELQNAVNENTGHRKLLLEKVMTACKELKLSPDEDSGARTEAKIAIIKLAEDLMTSTEGGINKSVTAELRRSTIDIEKERSSAIIPLCRAAKPTWMIPVWTRRLTMANSKRSKKANLKCRIKRCSTGTTPVLHRVFLYTYMPYYLDVFSTMNLTMSSFLIALRIKSIRMRNGRF